MKEKVLEEFRIFEGKVIDVCKYRVELPNGVESTREVVRHPGAAAVLPYANGKVFLVRQYRFPINEELLEAPAGKLDVVGEAPEECARRELEEETGFKANTFMYLGYIYTTPGFSDEIIHLYLATELEEKKPQNLDEDEIIDVVEMDWEEFYRACLEGKIVDSKTIALALRASKIVGTLHSDQ